MSTDTPPSPTSTSSCDVGARLHRARARAPRPAMGGGALVPRRGLSEARRPGPARAEVPGGVRRAGRRLPARGGAVRGDGTGRLRRHRRGDRRTHQHRHAADLEVRHRGAEAALPRARDPRRADRRAGDHRARRRLGRGRAHAPAPSASTAAGWSTARRPTSPTACARTSSSPPSTDDPARRPPRHLLPDRRPRRGRRVLRSSQKLGWHASDTATIAFQDVFVPEENLLGELNEGFKLIMANFQWERLAMALGAVGAMHDRVGAHRRVRARAPGVRAPARRATRRSATSSPTSRPPCTRAAASPTTRCAASSPARSR